MTVYYFHTLALGFYVVSFQDKLPPSSKNIHFPTSFSPLSQRETKGAKRPSGNVFLYNRTLVQHVDPFQLRTKITLRMLVRRCVKSTPALTASLASLRGRRLKKIEWLMLTFTASAIVSLAGQCLRHGHSLQQVLQSFQQVDYNPAGPFLKMFIYKWRNPRGMKTCRIH